MRNQHTRTLFLRVSISFSLRKSPNERQWRILIAQKATTRLHIPDIKSRTRDVNTCASDIRNPRWYT